MAAGVARLARHRPGHRPPNALATTDAGARTGLQAAALTIATQWRQTTR
jgi:hypothetical protein